MAPKYPKWILRKDIRDLNGYFFIISSERLSSYFSQSSSEEWIGGGIVFALDP